MVCCYAEAGVNKEARREMEISSEEFILDCGHLPLAR